MRNHHRRDHIDAATIPPFMLPRKWPATEGERAALFLPGRLLPSSRRGPDEPDDGMGRGR